jgi:nucleoside-diphosphate-sugar epimerase
LGLPHDWRHAVRKSVLLLGASGNIAPPILPGLEPHFDLRLADVAPHPDGRPVLNVDVTSYEQVLEASRGMDAVMNFTVVRQDPEQSFHVNTLGAWHVMKAAAELGIRKVIHTGPQTINLTHEHDFGVVDVPRTPGTNYYGCTKMLGSEICRIFARQYGIQTIAFHFLGLRLRPTGPVTGVDFHRFAIIYDDLAHACRLALDLETVPGGYQDFNMLSFEAHGRYSIDKARRILGFEPLERWEDYYRRTP